MAKLNALDPNGPLNAFNSNGSTYLLVGTAIQINPISGSTGTISYRIRNLSSASQYFTWGTNSASRLHWSADRRRSLREHHRYEWKQRRDIHLPIECLDDREQRYGV